MSRLARRGVRAALGVLLVTALAAACSPGPSTSPGPIATASLEAPASGRPTASGVIPGSPVAGVLVDIDASGLSEVAGFTLRLDDGRSLEFRLGTLENGAEFPPGHLAEHLATSTPIRVYFRLEGSELVAYRLEDAS